MPRYPCTWCTVNCGKNTSSIECSLCSGWIHRRCVPMDYEQFAAWTSEDLAFICRSCVFSDSGEYKYEEALNRLSSLTGSSSAAQSEALLLSTYNKTLPVQAALPLNASLNASLDASVDIVARQVLQLYHPIMLCTHEPLYVIGDGNCMFRALSMGLYGTYAHHLHIRLLTAFEIINNREHYDIDNDNFIDHFGDERLTFDKYPTLVHDVSKEGAYCGLMILSAASAALQTCFQSYCPPFQGSYFLSDPLTKLIRGRGVPEKASPVLTLMWTTSYVPKTPDEFRPNHFVLLRDMRKSAFVNLTVPEQSTPKVVGTTCKPNFSVTCIDDRNGSVVAAVNDDDRSVDAAVNDDDEDDRSVDAAVNDDDDDAVNYDDRSVDAAVNDDDDDAVNDDDRSVDAAVDDDDNNRSVEGDCKNWKHLPNDAFLSLDMLITP